ncbi:MAG: DUF1573 domain-containing protein [Bacteroidales bacterium]|nr:DUF1573 domain-containing protein [Bacteroidales bacterium]
MRFLYLILIEIIIVSCARDDRNIFFNAPLHEVAKLSDEVNLPYCLVLADSLDFCSIDFIEKFSCLKGWTLINFIDVSLAENEWYIKYLSPNTIPLTCVFDTHKKLIDIVPGVSQEALYYVYSCCVSLSPSLEFHYNQKYAYEKVKLINQIDLGIKLKHEVDKGMNVISELDSLYHVSRNPYILYLKLMNQIDFAHPFIDTAKELIAIEKPQDVLRLHKEITYANSVLDLSYCDTAPQISLSPSMLYLERCDIDTTYILSVQVTNIGLKPLLLYDIITSCSCLKQRNKENTPKFLEANETIQLEFDFHVDATGEIIREVCFISNSIGNPIECVIIKATSNYESEGY